MFTSIADFLELWKTESELTIKIFSNITDEVMNNKINDNVRSLSRTAWHITQTLTEMPFKAGIITDDVLEEKPIPNSMAEIIEIYNKHSNKLVANITEKWNDLDLSDEINIYNQKWKKSKFLLVLINHQIHHRAQMTVVMRLLDIIVPGIYGPSKEEWSKFGMETQE